MPHHLTAKAPAAPHIRPVCDLTQEVRAVPLPEPQTDCAEDVPAIAEDISSVSDTAAVTQCAQGVPEPEPAADTVIPEVSPTVPARQKQHPNESTSAPKESTPQMGDTRVADGKKQVYFFGFGWIDENSEGGGGIIVDGDGDINKMVGDM
ncbi:DUF6550 family protein [Lacrimispora sp. BS-2]|uniref:DUF6550 family protein n=1 Tax=Lacrimispora sp. BS-2 TaxID=3151850 RepID=A0AAU7PR78_9FIRM